MLATQNSSFLLSLPTLQFAWDSTSLGALKTCPRYYQLAILEGWQPRRLSVHLTFGLHYHSALEQYDHLKAQSQTHESALLGAVHHALKVTWDSARQRPWFSDDDYKNRFTLLRSIIWYLDQFADDSIETIILSNGKPAVELSFRWNTDYLTPEGTPYIICGHLDRLGLFQGHTYVIDRKTTKSTISQDFFDKFSPDNQMSTYALSGTMVYSVPIKGIIVDGAQVAVTFTRFARGFVPRTNDQLSEWYEDFGMWVGLAEVFAHNHSWPMNDKSCGNYGGCQFRGICSQSPAVREKWLQADFIKRVWDPLQTRGDI